MADEIRLTSIEIGYVAPPEPPMTDEEREQLQAAIQKTGKEFGEYLDYQMGELLLGREPLGVSQWRARRVEEMLARLRSKTRKLPR